MFRKIWVISFLFWGLNASIFYIGSENAHATAPVSDCSGVIVSEFIANPSGSDTDGEWIELYNQTDSEINLEGYTISDSEGTVHKYTVGKASILPHAFLLFDRKTTGITLNNDKESVVLGMPNGSICQTGFAVPDTNVHKGDEGQSFAYDEKMKTWKWTTTPTHAAMNVFTEAPVPEEEDESENVLNNSCSGIMITEIMPNPSGPDGQNEWIELYNSNGDTVDLGGCIITDKLKAGSTKKHTVPKGTLIASGDYLIFARPATKITLNNDSDGVALLSSSGVTIFETEIYENPEENAAYAYSYGRWVWTTIPTPGEANIISEPVSKEAKKAAVKSKKKVSAKAPKSTKKSVAKDTSQDSEVLGANSGDDITAQGKVNDKMMGYILVGISAILLIGYVVWINKDFIYENSIKKFRRNG